MALNLKKKKTSDAAPAVANRDFVPGLPTVNVLPSEVMQIVEVQRLKRQFVFAGFAALVLMAGAFVAQTATIQWAQNSLEKEQSRTSALDAEVKKLAPVKLFYTEIKANSAVIQTTLEKEVLYSTVVSGLKKSTSAGITLGNVSLSGTEGGASACLGPDPFSQDPTVGCATIVGTATSRQAVGVLIQQLQDSPLFTNAFVNATNVDESGKVSWNGTVGLTDAVYSNRYTPENFAKEMAP